MDKIFFDSADNRLVYVKQQANEGYWDRHWSALIKRIHSNPPRNLFYTKLTQKYLPKGAVVLEGGCGMGDKVLALHNDGFKSIGIDYAQNTIDEISKSFPFLDVRLGDVRKLPIKDGEVDGYWSLGVIEHFYDGYDEILDEMRRVIKPGGYLFLTFPSISKYRKHLINSKHYDDWDKSLIGGFYQFALTSSSVQKKFESNGFKLVETQYTGNLKGLKSHSLFGGFCVNLAKLPSPIPTIVSQGLDKILKDKYSHMTLLVLKRI